MTRLSLVLRLFCWYLDSSKFQCLGKILCNLLFSGLGWRGRQTSTKGQPDVWSLLIFHLSLTVFADKVEIILLRFNLSNSQALAVLPYITLLTSNTMRTVVLLSHVSVEGVVNCERTMTYHVLTMHSTARAIENPILICRKAF